VIPHVRRLALPLPFELSEVNAYLVKLRDGWLLIDSGLNTEECFQALARQAEIDLREIRQILLTHAHPDHVGGARRLLDLTGAELLMEASELAQMHMVAASGPRPAWLTGPMTRAGVAAKLVDQIHLAFGEIRRNFTDLQPHRVLQENDVIETAAGELRVVKTPGHSVGHACLYSEEHRTLFAGDTLLETITPNISWMEGRDMLGEFLASLGRVAGMDIETLLPGHFAPFSGHREWIQETQDHHVARCEQLLSSLGRGAKTANALVGEIWMRPLAPFHHRFAVFEILAHLEYLRRLGKVRCGEADGAELWQAN
jgi:glyoxylase-like metal-dependent hydrolase (beta-lactamase superfamily II)